MTTFKHYISLSLLLMLSLVWACNPAETFIDNTPPSGNANGRTLRILLTNAKVKQSPTADKVSAKVFGQVSEPLDDHRGGTIEKVQSFFEQGDRVQLLFVQNRRYYILPNIQLQIINNNKSVSIQTELPEGIDPQRPYDVYGLTGNARWKSQGYKNIEAPYVFIPYIAPAGDVNSVLKEMPMQFHISQNSVAQTNATLEPLGILIRYQLYTYNSGEMQGVMHLYLLKKIGNDDLLPSILTHQDNPRIPKDQKGWVMEPFGNNDYSKKDHSIELSDNFTANSNENNTMFVWRFLPENLNFPVNLSAWFEIKNNYLTGRGYTGPREMTFPYIDRKNTYSLDEYKNKDTFAVISHWKAKKAPDFSMNNWMASLPDESPFFSLAIPGTHDAATYTLSGATGFGFVKCQDADITRQLNLGIRVLDLRVAWDKDGKDAELSHAFVETGVYLGKVYEDAITFLNTHPSETIVFLIKNEQGKDLKSAIKYLSEKYKDRIINNTVMTDHFPFMTLGQMRGKILTLYRDEKYADAAGVNGGYYIGGWSDNTAWGRMFIWKGWRQKQLFEVQYQDNYNVSSYDGKWEVFKNLIDVGKDYIYQEKWCFNYLSGTKAPFITPSKLSKYLNPKALNYFLYEQKYRLTGVVFMDFAGTDGPGLPEAIINNNFKVL